MNESVARLSETKFYMTQNLYPPKLKSVDNRFYITKYRDSVNCSAFYYTNIKYLRQPGHKSYGKSDKH